jgi:hypothetical protein
MLSYGSALRLDDRNGWSLPRAPSATPRRVSSTNSASILLRIKGADLNAYMMKKLTGRSDQEDRIKKVEVG